MQKRVEWLDTARGIGILLVVIGHALTTVIRKDSALAKDIYDAIYYVHLPLLFFVSGLAFNLASEKYKRQSPKSYLISKLKRLMVPYIVYSLIVYCIFRVANSIPSITSILVNIGYGKITVWEWLRGLIVANNIYCEHLWYIYSLFLLSVFAFLVLKVVGKWYKYILVFVTFLLWLFFSNPTYYHLVWKTSMRGIWFAFGCLIGIKKGFSKLQQIVIIVGGTLIIGVHKIVLKSISYRVGTFVSLFIIFMYVLIFLVISQLIDAKGDRVIKFLGKNSFAIYLFHQPFWGSGVGVVLYKVLHLPIFVCVVLSVLLCIIVPLILDQVLKKPCFGKIRLLLLGS